MRSVSVLLPVGLIAVLAGANLLVGAVADADALPDDPAPTEVPEGAALTGNSLPNQVDISGVQASLAITDEGPKLSVYNPGDEAVEIELQTVATYSSGSSIGRMGPITMQYPPRSRTLSLIPGQRVTWKVDLAMNEPEDRAPVAVSTRRNSAMTTRNSALGSGGTAVRRLPNLDFASSGSSRSTSASLADLAVDNVVLNEDVEFVDVGDNTPLLLRINSSSYESWTVRIHATVDGDAGDGLLVASL